MDKLDTSTIVTLIENALAVREHSYSPYSKFAVGAALLTEDGEIFVGCNVESAAYSPTNCAERSALFTAVSAGKRRFSAIAVVGGEAGKPPAQLCYPCGVCRQMLQEFNNGNLIVIVATSPESYEVHTLSALLPYSFSANDLTNETNVF